MVVMILENVSPSLRGKLTRWLIEPRAGVFVGKISALVREKLWEMCVDNKKEGGVIQIWSDANEQGFSVRSEGDTSREVIDCEGLWLVLQPSKESQKPKEDISRKRESKL